ncbi:delta and Notch-like epidermal growth factor-related receptor [Lates japonicus]|uniref:Delta and Notch-like epidermal growth factor-related receptor n=1 Tax=Lates japonicus TaxID=270547 RepID=A0AAD3NNB4_LATJO|nr:delta and Notch-like epidermal growth factor-related receptor [Lates japonicus]
MRTSVCSVPAGPRCRPTQAVRSFTSFPLLLLLLLLLSSSSSISGGSIGAVPSPFQLAPDTPAPAEPTPTQATPRPDPCEGRPCLNGGFCLALPSAGRPEDTWEYTCTCSQGFTGRNCEFFTDPCASSPCLHGNYSRSDSGEEGEPAYTCECTEGYVGERCDQILLDLPAADWDPATPSALELATPVASTTAAATQPPQPTTVATTTTTTPAPPTLPPWQPKPGQRLLVVPWEADRVWRVCTVDSSVATQLSFWCFAVYSSQTGSFVALWQETHARVLLVSLCPAGAWLLPLRVVVNASGLSALAFERRSFLTFVHFEQLSASFLQAPDGLVVPRPPAALGQNYFLSKETSNLLSVLGGRAPQINHPASQPGGEGQQLRGPAAAVTLSVGKANAVTQPSEQPGLRPRCYCRKGYQGATCEQKVDPCASSPCHNNGTCYAQGPGPLGFGCSCTAGFTGPTCAQLVDFCALNPCAHGVCRSVGNSYRCLCVPGYHGLYCEGGVQ